ncbi:MAG: HAMP domain-containing sensor histidine kinase, partial [Oligoflexia bacterium]|nr:HAMP domain-containing sensor histidine kinase [Oligoflexia bacterium]
FSLFALWLNVSSLYSAYVFLKSSLVSFSKNGLFPLPQFKSPLLYFYNNRLAVLNKKKPSNKLENQPESKTFQGLIRDEISQLKKRFPNLAVTEDFQSNVKIFGSERFLQTVIHELLLNALESMGAKKKQEVALNLREEKNSLVFSVRDYGSGLKEAEKAFQMYYSTKSQLGVGLNLVQSIVKAKGGKIKLQPFEEGGAQAILSLPLKLFLKQY